MRRLLAVVALLLLASCAGQVRNSLTTASAGAPEWPAAPETARVQFMASITRHQDLFLEGGFASGLLRVVTGDVDSRMVRPYAIAVYPDGGGLLVGDPGAQCVHFYDTGRRNYERLGEDMEGGLPSPVGIAVLADGGILVSDSRLGAIERFGRDGKLMGTFGEGYALQRPTGIAVDSKSGDVYVADVLGQCIVVYTAGGEFLRSFGENGSDPGQFNFPTHVAISAEGDLLVADSMNFRIQRLSLDGKPMAVYGEAGDAQGDFARPKGIAGVGNGVYTAVEGLYDSLIFFNGSGDLLLTIGGAGSEPGQFWLPAGLAFDPVRRLLFVADSYNSRVQVFHLLNVDGATGNENNGTKEAAP